jgi:orotidine-5'-phosphate decarboxylase
MSVAAIAPPLAAAVQRLCVALDFSSVPPALDLFERLQGRVGLFKVGSELFLQAGPDAVRKLTDRGATVFLDLKFHDIPRTVAAAAREAARMGVAVFNMHASGGQEMMRAAAESARAVRPETRIIAVTVLTSLVATEDEVLRLATSAHEAGLDGVVASPKEMRALRARFGPDFLLVSPAVRPSWASSVNDHKRAATPADAASAGADYIVVGRPITESPDSVAAAARVVDEIQAAL